MDFELEQHFLFPSANLKDSDKFNSYSKISDKTKRDFFFNAYSAEDDYEYGDNLWK